jgi:hypothetical protein
VDVARRALVLVLDRDRLLSSSTPRNEATRSSVERPSTVKVNVVNAMA